MVENRGGADFFFEIASIAQFLSEIKKEGIKLFRRAIPFYPDPKKMVSSTLGGGWGRVNFQITPKKLFI